MAVLGLDPRINTAIYFCEQKKIPAASADMMIKINLPKAQSVTAIRQRANLATVIRRYIMVTFKRGQFVF